MWDFGSQIVETIPPETEIGIMSKETFVVGCASEGRKFLSKNSIKTAATIC